MSCGVNVLALLKGGERYVFLFDDESHEQLLQTLGNYAGDPELSFTWYDAAVLSQRAQISQSEQQRKHHSPSNIPEQNATRNKSSLPTEDE